jgi:hypothetical protein
MKQMNTRRGLIVLLFVSLIVAGCHEKPPPPYGSEHQLSWWGPRQQVWAIAPAVNLSGEEHVDPLLQADLLYQQLQAVSGITVIPVNRVAEVYASLRIEKVESEEQAAIVCDLLGADGLIVPSVTMYDPYDPPKFGVALQLFTPHGILSRQASIDVHELTRQATPGPNDAMPSPTHGNFIQVVGMFDSANGSVRQAVLDYAKGRNDPTGPLGSKEYFVNMDRYCGFVYCSLIEELINQAGR